MIHNTGVTQCDNGMNNNNNNNNNGNNGNGDGDRGYQLECTVFSPIQ